MIQLPITGPYTAKDQAKSNRANKFIGRGSARSSTNKYREAWGTLANCGNYDETDIVFISSEGNRSGRLAPDFVELQKAIDGRTTFVTDKLADRERPYNGGEREIARYLVSQGYQETAPGTWSPTA